MTSRKTPIQHSALDDFEGPLTEFVPNPIMHDYRAMFRYCEERGITPEQLTDAEIDKFATGPIK